MTTAHIPTSTERVPARAWTVRLTGRSDRSATVSCSNTNSRMPPPSKDPAALRQFAARHAAAHAKAATIHPGARCHCGAHECASHPQAKAQCAGTAAVLVLRHDATVGQVWNVQEVCTVCARLLPHATVVTGPAGRPTHTDVAPAAQGQVARPLVPGGFSSPAAGPTDTQAAPGRRRGRASQLPRRHRPTGKR
ncbi:hypothetical protein [Streptomyces sp. NPDC007206]|uniref:hypothetical protein n=1 Tax=Streptomyces sp. NPDC007206 TaxID=3154317 RepID=UPI0033EFDD5D